MAKAKFHKGQKVFVRPVGTWAIVEQVLPSWTKGIEEPIKINYECGLGREFTSDELDAQNTEITEIEELEGRSWRVIRARNRWQGEGESTHHPHPGTFPIVVTADTDWGGWRVPAAEYDLYPEKIEKQAQIMSRALDLMKVMMEMNEYTKTNPEDLSDEMMDLVKKGTQILQRKVGA